MPEFAVCFDKRLENRPLNVLNNENRVAEAAESGNKSQ